MTSLFDLRFGCNAMYIWHLEMDICSLVYVTWYEIYFSNCCFDFCWFSLFFLIKFLIFSFSFSVLFISKQNGWNSHNVSFEGEIGMAMETDLTTMEPRNHFYICRVLASQGTFLRKLTFRYFYPLDTNFWNGRSANKGGFSFNCPHWCFGLDDRTYLVES